LTFALIAADAGNEEKFNRNRRNARRACDTARGFISRVELSDDHAAELHTMLEELEYRLQVLDCSDATSASSTKQALLPRRFRVN